MRGDVTRQDNRNSLQLSPFRVQLRFPGARNGQGQQEGDEEMPGHGGASSLTDTKKRKRRKRKHQQGVLEEVEEGLQLVYMVYICIRVSLSLQETQGTPRTAPCP